MCGIIGAASERDVLEILMDGLKRLEYRGYDSAGIVLLEESDKDLGKKKVKEGNFVLEKVKGKVNKLQKQINKNIKVKKTRRIGIGHTRWATHGIPSVKNAHPHLVKDRIAIVHNGIIENYKELIKELKLKSNDLTSDTDTEVIAHYIYRYLQKGDPLLKAVTKVAKKLVGAYAICVVDKKDPNKIIAVRQGSPLVVGFGFGEHFFASDPLALQKVSQEFIYLEDGDIVELDKDNVKIYDANGKKVQRKIHSRELDFDVISKGEHRHYMHKEIFEQEKAIENTIFGKITKNNVLIESFGVNAKEIFSKTENVQIVACGTSYHAGLVAKYWIEKIAKIPCFVEIASEFRYRDRVTLPNTLFVTISQSGETMDTLSALKVVKDKERKFLSGILTICNVPESSLMRASDLSFLTQAGPEIGVATTKGFTTQLVALLLLSLSLADVRNSISDLERKKILKNLKKLSKDVGRFLKKYANDDNDLKKVARLFMDKEHALFLGRGLNFPIAMEGALKLKEISYIHAEAYAAGELKHGPLALVDKKMLIIVLAPNDELLEKVKSNISEIASRDGKLLIFTEEGQSFADYKNANIITLPKIDPLFSPILYTIPLQILSYDVAVLKGTDIDQPRNLAKSVTVE